MAVMMIDGYDLMAMPLAVPHVAQQLGVTPGSFGVVLSAVLVGLGLGALLLGPLGDRLGRRPVIIPGLMGLAGFTLGTATAGTLWEFALWRLGTGACLGACLTNVTALVSELAPPARRSATLSLIACGVSVGAIAAGILAPLLVGLGGWQGMFLVPGAATVLLGLLALFVLPESPSVSSARRSRDLLQTEPVSKAMGPATAAGKPPLLALLAPPYRTRTAIFVFLYTLNACALYLVSNWLPTVLPRAGFTLTQAAHFSSLQSTGSLAIGLGLSWLLDRHNQGALLVWSYLVIALGFIAFSLVPVSAVGWGALVFIAAGGVAGVHLCLMAVGTGLYPPQILSSAVGLAVAAGRVGAIAGPLLGGLLIDRQATPAQFFLLCILPVVFCLLGSLRLATLLRSAGFAGLGPPQERNR
ncbi:MAG: MFS transporter [Gammaproteobacteria bacterium]|nr:MFS transporter [Gammaproteobacteria bacterium]